LFVVWVMWPASDAELLAKAQEVLSGDDREAWHVARREYLEPLLARSPEPSIAQEAQSLIDRIDMADAEERMLRNVMLNRKGATPGERLFVQARKYDEFGDAATAILHYEKLSESLDSAGPDRPFVKLAERRAKELRERSDPLRSSAEMLEQKLEEADQLVADGSPGAARRLWDRMDRILTLYEERDDVLPQYRRAQERLLGLGKPSER
jgi:hypothetical protein